MNLDRPPKHLAMERSSSRYELNEGDDRRSRFQNTTGNEDGSSSSSSSLRDRASSQPPGASDNTTFVSSPTSQYYFPSTVGGPWTNSRMLSSNRVVPIRSSSLSTNPQGPFSSMRGGVFPSTFEDDESEALSDTYDELHVPQSLSRGRTYGQDPSRSRSQSMASRTVGVGSPYTGSSAMQSWTRNNTNPLNIPGGQQRYGDIKPPSGSSRYGSLGTTMARSPTNIHPSSSPSGPSFVANGFSHRHQQHTDISNMSPFVRDVGQILVDDGAAFRELWAGMHPPRDENGGGGSGTTSRRHSVSVVQPRRGNVVGFHAPGGVDPVEEPSRSSFQPAYPRSGLLLSDDDLASDLGLLNLNPNDPPPPSSSQQQHPPSQPSSLPIYAPLSRSPPSRDLMSKYQSINLSIPGGTTPYSRQTMGTPSEGDFSAGGNSPGLYEQHLSETHFNSGRQQPELTARYIPGQGIQYLPSPQQQGQGGSMLHHQPPSPQYGRTRAPSYSSTSTITSPISPSTGRAINPQQPPYYPQTQRRLSDAQYHLPPPPPSSSQQQNLSDLGKGVPLHSVPSSWPLFIVEFKAGRTDLFYLTDLTQDIRIGDLVMVEADRGKDLGTVVNDSITLAEVEAFQRQQMERGYGGSGGGGSGGSGEPTSPGGMNTTSGGNGKKEINPKMIYGKATAQEMQYVFLFLLLFSLSLTFFFFLSFFFQ